MEGHIYAALVEKSDANKDAYILHTTSTPLLSLLVSGAHTELVLSESIGEYKLLGSTRDDAAGECFDKCARLLGLPYPGGPEIARLAKEAREKNAPNEFTLPRPMLHDASLDFSFSGLKTALLRVTEKNPILTDLQKCQIAREVEDAIVEVLVKKTVKAAELYAPRTIVLSGGVSANVSLVDRLTDSVTKHDTAVVLKISPRALSTDNAFMIACAAAPKALAGIFTTPEHIQAKGNASLSAIQLDKKAS
jgi:N6-L-threonylcarbamoyladenine synthase